MDEKETSIILKYKRPCDSWLCPECDTENDMSLGRCTVCGCGRSSSVEVLKQWTEQNEKTVIPPKKITSPTPEHMSKETGEDEYAPEDENKNKIIWGIIIAIIIIGLIIAASQGSTYASYSDAVNELNNGNYETAISMFEELPHDYKDVSDRLDEAKYQCATEYLNTGDFTSAESLFKTISYYNDSEDKLNECKYQNAVAMLNAGNYTEAKNKFQEMSSYSSSSEMVKECDYMLAEDYKNNGEYVKAMKIFSEIAGYKDSNSQFDSCESLLKQYNSRNGYFYNENSLLGDWRDESGYGVTYTRKADGSTDSSYNMGFTKGKFFKISESIHYHGDDYSGWNKQWIFQKIDANKISVYNYIDGMIYTLSKN